LLIFDWRTHNYLIERAEGPGFINQEAQIKNRKSLVAFVLEKFGQSEELLQLAREDKVLFTEHLDGPRLVQVGEHDLGFRDQFAA
jgi:hypothetical protein